MEIKVHNPTPWLQHFGLNHAVEVRGGTRTVYLSGQTASDSDGTPMHAGDLVAQAREAWNNLKLALEAADMTPRNLVRLNFYVTDVEAFMDAADRIVPLYVDAGAQVACTLLGVKALYHPDILIEMEATAVS